MKSTWKSILPLVLTTLVSLTSFLSADSDSAQLRHLENRVNSLEQRKGAGGMINPQARPQVRDGADLFIFGDFLYWNAHQNGMNMSLRQEKIVSTQGTTTALNDATVESIHGKWNVGFRTGFGYNTMHDGWDIKLTWLRFTDTGVNRAHSSTNAGYYASTIMPSAATNGVISNNSYSTSGHGYWGFNINQLDLDMGREFFVSKWLTVRPHVALRTDWIHQSFNVRNRNLTSKTGSIVHAVEVENKDHWYGMGLCGGIDTQWGLGNGWSIFGNTAASILYGFHQISTENSFVATAGSDSITYGNVHNSYRISHPVLDLQMGLRWDTMFSRDRFHIGLALGWEHHIYFSQNQFPVYASDNNPGIFVSNQGDLTLQGWTFSARFDF